MVSRTISNTDILSDNDRRWLPLLSLAENAIYTAKNHYKSADVNRYMRYFVNILTIASLFSILIPYLDSFSKAVQTVAAFAAMANVMLVTGYLSVFKEIEYLQVGDSFKSIYEDCFKVFCSFSAPSEVGSQYDLLQKKFNEISGRPISKLPRMLAKRALMHKNAVDDEVDLRWLRVAKEKILNG